MVGAEAVAVGIEMGLVIALGSVANAWLENNETTQNNSLSSFMCFSFGDEGGTEGFLPAN